MTGEIDNANANGTLSGAFESVQHRSKVRLERSRAVSGWSPWAEYERNHWSVTGDASQGLSRDEQIRRLLFKRIVLASIGVGRRIQSRSLVPFVRKKVLPQGFYCWPVPGFRQVKEVGPTKQAHGCDRKRPSACAGLHPMRWIKMIARPRNRSVRF